MGDSIGRLYINGIQQGADKTFVDLVLPNAGTNLTIGSGTGNIYPFNGLIDEVVLLNVAADEEDIQEIMNQGLERASGVIAVEFSGKLTSTLSKYVPILAINAIVVGLKAYTMPLWLPLGYLSHSGGSHASVVDAPYTICENAPSA